MQTKNKYKVKKNNEITSQKVKIFISFFADVQTIGINWKTTTGGCWKTLLQLLEESNKVKCFLMMWEIWGSDGLKVVINGGRHFSFLGCSWGQVFETFVPFGDVICEVEVMGCTSYSNLVILPFFHFWYPVYACAKGPLCSSPCSRALQALFKSQFACFYLFL